MENLNTLVVFVKVAETKSFTGAALRLGLTASAISKAISKLEHELGVRLLHRTTRRVNLTDEGAGFHERCRQILAEIEEAKSAITATRVTPLGQLRFQMPVGFGRLVVAPALLRFTSLYPDLTVDAELSDRVVDVAYEGMDAAIQIGQVSGDARLAARKLCTLRFGACASPGYLALHGEPATPDDLDHHQCLGYRLPLTGSYREWQFKNADGRVFTKNISGRLNMNNAESLLEAAVAGAGITMASNFITNDAVRKGRLKRILADYVAPGPDVHLVYLSGRSMSAKLRLFIEFLMDVVGKMDDV